MAAKKSIGDNITIAVEIKKPEAKGVTVPVFIPEVQGSGGDMKVDQYEHVTIANEEGEKCWQIHRGESVDIPVEVFEVLKPRYPKL